MTQISREPWIVTDDRLPYLVYPLGIPRDVIPAMLAGVLEAKARRACDSYSRAAYFLSTDNSVLACLRNSPDCHEAAIIVFINEPLPWNERGENSLQDKVCQGLSVLNRMLERSDGQEPIRILRIDPLEVSQRAA